MTDVYATKGPAVSLRFTEHQRQALERIRIVQGFTLNEIIRRAVDAYIKEYDHAEQASPAPAKR